MTLLLYVERPAGQVCRTSPLRCAAHYTREGVAHRLESREKNRRAKMSAFIARARPPFVCIMRPKEQSHGPSLQHRLALRRKPAKCPPQRRPRSFALGVGVF